MKPFDVDNITVSFNNGCSLTLCLIDNTPINISDYPVSKTWNLLYQQIDNAYPEEFNAFTGRLHPQYKPKFSFHNTEFFPEDKYEEALIAFYKRLNSSNPKESTGLGYYNTVSIKYKKESHVY